MASQLYAEVHSIVQFNIQCYYPNLFYIYLLKIIIIIIYKDVYWLHNFIFYLLFWRNPLIYEKYYTLTYNIARYTNVLGNRLKGK